MTRRIVLAVGAAEPSAAPGRVAVWLAAELDAGITVVYVARELDTLPAITGAGGIDEDAARERMVTKARERVAAWAHDVLGDTPFDIVIEQGKVAERVAAAAEALSADLIIAGSRGRSALEGTILGDTTRDILRRAACPVVVVPPRAAVR